MLLKYDFHKYRKIIKFVFDCVENLKGDLDDYVKRFNGKVRVIRNEQREGTLNN